MDDIQRRLEALKARLYKLSREQHEYEQAVVVGEEALQLSTEIKRDTDPSSLALLNNLATSYQHLGQHDRSEATFRRALSLARAHFDEDSSELLALVNNCADACRLGGKFADAEAYYHQLEAALLRTVGEAHPHYALTLTGRALIREATGDVSESILLLRRAVDILRNALGTNHPLYLESLWNLAMVHRHHGEAKAAEPLLEEIVRLTPEVMGGRHPISSQAIAELKRVRMELRKSEVTPTPQIRQPSPADLQRCMDNFEARDYTGCIRTLTPYLETGAPAFFMLLAMVCLKRLGRDWHDFVTSLESMAVLCDDDWDSALVQMAMGSVSPDDVLERANTPTRKCQCQYYIAALFRTEDPDHTRTMLEMCLTPPVDCHGQIMARLDLRDLAPDVASAAELEPESSATITKCLDAFTRRDYRTHRQLLHVER